MDKIKLEDAQKQVNQGRDLREAERRFCQKYLLVLRDVDGRTIEEKYSVYQKAGRDQLKVVVVRGNTCIGLQG